MNQSEQPSAGAALASARHYHLVCEFCGAVQEDDGLVLDCSADHPPALLRAEYATRSFTPRASDPGLFRYRDWLPVVRCDEGVGGTAVYRSKHLAEALGVQTLWIAFNGYWPERGAWLETATFKEFEARTVLGRLPEKQVILSAASSGNTGAALAWTCSQSRTPCVLVVPESGLHRMRFREPLDPCVTVVAVDGGYPDATALAAEVANRPGFMIEGGVKNVARRDGLGTVLLWGYERMGRLPTHYFQAVGSGTGAIAVLQAAKRLRQAGCADPLPQLILCQNAPFTPLYDAWHQDPVALNGAEVERFRRALGEVAADELTNLSPPYSCTGGVRDALTESRGDMLSADNTAVRKAMDMFQALEGIDIEPAAGVAVAGLAEAVERDMLDRESVVLLNVTGGGRGRLAHDNMLIPAEPALRVPPGRLFDPEQRNQAAASIAELAQQRAVGWASKTRTPPAEKGPTK